MSKNEQTQRPVESDLFIANQKIEALNYFLGTSSMQEYMNGMEMLFEYALLHPDMDGVENKSMLLCTYKSITDFLKSIQIHCPFDGIEEG